MATFKPVSFNVSLTLEEVRILAEGLRTLSREYDDGLRSSMDQYEIAELRDAFMELTN